MNGPFLVERAINPLARLAASQPGQAPALQLTLLAPAHDERVRALVVARLVAARRLARPGDGRPKSFPRHRHADGRPGSSTRRGYADAVPPTAPGPPCRW